MNAGSLILECLGVLHEGLLVPVLIYECEMVVWKKKKDPYLGREEK